MTLSTATATALASATTTEGVTEREVQAFATRVERRIGVRIGDKAYLIESRLQPLVAKFELESISEFLTKIERGNRAFEEAAIEAMTTNETSFFRDQHPFRSLADEVMPRLLAGASDRLTIWNGACSSGQESYTLAMVISDRYPEATRSRRVRIVSTDVSPEMVERTAAGAYSRFEVNRGLPAHDAARYFDSKSRQWVAKQELRDMIEARQHNLLESFSSLPKADVVLLRNVLIYFSNDMKRDILRRVRTEVLQPGGCLVLGASEMTNGIDDGYEAKRIGASTFFFSKGPRT